jgi:hypothetical protein
MMDERLEVPLHIRELAVKSIDQVEQAFGFFFNAASAAVSASAATPHALLQRTVQAKLAYARRLAFSKSFRETTAAHAAFLRTQIEIASDLIRISSKAGD